MMYRHLFAVIGVCSIGAVTCFAQVAERINELASPLQPAAVEAPAEFVYPLELNAAAYEAVRGASTMRLTGFPLAQGWQIDLDLEQFDVLAPGAPVIVADGEFEIDVGRPDIVLLRGRIAGLHDSAVYLALSPHGSNGFIRLPHQSWIIATPASAEAVGHDAPLPTVMYELSALPAGAINWVDFQCGADAVAGEPPEMQRLLHKAAMMNHRGAGSFVDDAPCRRVRIAIDTDWQYTTRFSNNSTTLAQAYIFTLMGAISEIYVREVNTSFEIVYTRVWSSNSTPYSATTVNDRLNEFRSHWNSNMGSVSRHVAHILTGLRSGAGGVAWLGQLCGGSYSYGASGYINGSFPYPIVNNHSQNWDLMVVAHEIGHNFNAPHTHSMSPPIDGCGSGDCSLSSQGTIMSYCHTCSGGMSNMRMDLHERIINERILPYLSSASCAASLLCPVDPGRCCLPDGSCELMGESACNQIAGALFGGIGTTCTGASCPAPGACCLSDGSCVIVPESQCTAIFAGIFRGEGVNCGEGRCATEPVLWNNGPVMTHTGIACSGRDLSMVPTVLGNTTRGLGWAATGQRIADPFIVPSGDVWSVNGVVLFGYDTSGSGTTYTSARIRIWDGDPRDPTSNIVAGDLTTNRLTNVTLTNVHRQWQTQATTCSRRIQQLDCSLQVTLEPGVYWIERSATASGTPWMPMVTFPDLQGKPNSLSLQFSQNSWSAISDAGNNAAQAMPFILLGSVVSDCYANCDGSTTVPVLNVDDFTCFINEFASSQSLPYAQQVTSYANCDGSTQSPVLNVDDFTCFINEFAQGCQ